MKKENIIFAISMMMMIYVVGCMIQVNMHNMSGSGTQNSKNIFVIAEKIHK